MKFIYWNIKNTTEEDILTALLKEHTPDLLFISEVDNEWLTKINLSLNQVGYEYFPNPGCERVCIVRSLNLDIDLHKQSKYYTVVHEKKSDIFIVSVHLPSQMFQHLDALKEFLRDFRNTIDVEVGDSLRTKIVVIGDFNVNPFEKAMIDYDGFVATNSRKSRSIISHLQKKRTPYYNPTWQLYSRRNFPGTKYFARPSGSSYDIIEFHFLDQVVVSNFLMQQLKTELISVIETAGIYVLFDSVKNSVNSSDHLPIMYQFNV